jgi:hypothetical protein
VELSTFYRHIYLNLPGFTRLVGVAGVGAPLSFGVFLQNSIFWRADERTRTADLLVTNDNSCVAGVCTGLRIPHI